MRLVQAQIATRAEIKRSWTLVDVVKWNETLDVREEIERREAEKNKNARA